MTRHAMETIGDATRIEALEAENARLRAALEEIRDRHIPDQPLADDSDEATYARKHHSSLRAMAAASLRGQA